MDIYIKGKANVHFRWRSSHNSLSYLEESPPPPTDPMVPVGIQAPEENELHSGRYEKKS